MKERAYSKDIAHAINEYLTNDGWHYSFYEDDGYFDFNFTTRGKIRTIQYVIDVKADSYIVYAVSPIYADNDNKEMMIEMADFIYRANYGLKDGNFELDMRDGEIRFKCFVPCDGIIPTKDIIKDSIYCPAVMFSRYGDGLLGVIFNSMSGKEAVELCENDGGDPLESTLRIMSEIKGPEGRSDLLTRLAESLGLSDDDDDDDDDDDSDESEDSVCIKTNLFDSEDE